MYYCIMVGVSEGKELQPPFVFRAGHHQGTCCIVPVATVNVLPARVSCVARAPSAPKLASLSNVLHTNFGSVTQIIAGFEDLLRGAHQAAGARTRK